MAENKGIYFTELKLQNVRCFGDEAVLKLSNDKGEWSRWNVILGDNGTGKTTLLQCLAGMELTSIMDEYVPGKLGKRMVPKIYVKDNKSFLKVDATSKKFNLYCTLADFQNSIKFFINHTASISGPEFAPMVTGSAFIIGYGANRRISFQILSEKELEPENSETLYDVDAKLVNTDEWLLQIEFAASRDSEIKELAIKRRDLMLESLKSILPDIEKIRFKDSNNIEKPVPRLEFKTPYGWVGIRELSYGYETVVAWIVDVAARMFKQYPESDNPLHEPVIILVDEIDLHMHPKWQRQIFEFLEKRFPRAQFIVTAHSPLIVQSAPKDANIIVLKKEQVGDEFVVRIDNNPGSVWSWRVDQILASDIFGMDSLRNPEIERLMNERTRLIQKGKNNLTGEEAARLAELNDLSHRLPTADNKEDIEAMEIIREAADFIKKQQKQNDPDKK